jgi:hypothetical protein
MQNIEIMFHDGMLGPKATLLALSSLTTGNLNSKLKQGTKPFRIEDVLPSTYDYIHPPLTSEEQKRLVSQQLLAFMSQAPGADKALNGIRSK